MNNIIRAERPPIPELAVFTAPIPAFNPVAEPIPFLPERIILSENLTLSATDTGLVLWRDGSPVAWVYAGYHEDQNEKQPNRCDFVDVAYHRQNIYGVNLETRDFLTLTEALQFVSDFFGGDS